MKRAYEICETPAIIEHTNNESFIRREQREWDVKEF